MKFLEDLLWGSTSADSQYEGGFEENGRGVTTQDSVADGNADVPRTMAYRLLDGTRGETPARAGMPKDVVGGLREGRYYPGHQVVDFYHHYREDIRYLADVGLSHMWFSICWTRIFPTDMEGKPNKKGLGFYKVVVDEYLEYGIQPLITICHDELPVYLAEHYQGWTSRVTIDYYVRFRRALFE